MKLLRTVAELRAALAPRRRAGERIGLVPTMGAFHEGHLALMRRARHTCDVVVVSLFVNPVQFRPGEDLAAYPRDEAHDTALAAEWAVDLLFVPELEEVYPDGFATTVAVAGLTEPLEGEARGPEHFPGVTTVVCKLFNMVGPDVAFFGQKDGQQAAVVRRMVSDLDIPVEIEILPTVREPDGLALSSRNACLGPADRERAVALHRALEAAEQAVARGEREPGAVRKTAMSAMAPFDVEPEYLALVRPDTLAPVDAVEGDVMVAVAARVGRTRLIDNTLIHTNGRPR
ncbi:MAG: pantoate--beta-alanine ligase [Solirubrobacteraceae bacterium]